MPRRLWFDWRRVLVYTHRWLGIAGCALFVMWFVSGIVMMYARMPSLSAEERLLRLPPLRAGRLVVRPVDAARAAGISPRSLRLAMLGERPVYRFATGGRSVTVFADTGQPLVAVDAGQALAIARQFISEHAATLRYDRRLVDSDQWTLTSGLRPLMPLHRIAVGDPDGTYLYVSESTGEPVMKTTRSGRRWGYLGAVVHWLYFTPLRRHAALWSQAIIWLSIAGCVMCLSGLVWGLWRFSPSARYRLKREVSHSPYAGMMYWHHYAGLVVGLTTFTWIFSGLLSMDPWDWSRANSPTRQQADAVSGGPLRLDLITLPRLKAGVAELERLFTPKEIEVLQFRSEPFLLAFRPPSDQVPHEWRNTDVLAFLSPQSALEHRLVSVTKPERGTFAAFAPEAVVTAAHAAMPGIAVEDAMWLDAYDPYYYDRHRGLPLPILRVRYADPSRTWLYVDPGRGAIVQKEERLTRANRWLYHGLHSLDFPFLYYRRPLWDIVVIALSVGGIVSGVTSVLPAWRRLRRHARRWRSRWYDLSGARG